MLTTIRMATLVLIAAALGTNAQAQGTAHSSEGRDLTVEIARPGTSAPHRPSRRPIHVSVMPIGPSSIAIGMPLGFRMVSTADAYGSLYVLSASGRTQVWLENVRLRAGEPIAYPLRGLIVRAAPPAGDETVIFVATRERLDGFAGGSELTNPLELQYTAEGFRDTIRDKFHDIPRERWALAEIKIRVHD
jgi:hypothetical protein